MAVFRGLPRVVRVLRVLRVLPVLAVLAAFLVAEGTAAAQARLRGPYLDIVWNYRDGNYQQAIILPRR